MKDTIRVGLLATTFTALAGWGCGPSNVSNRGAGPSNELGSGSAGLAPSGHSALANPVASTGDPRSTEPEARGATQGKEPVMASKKAIKGKTEVKTAQPVAYDEAEGPRLIELHLTETFSGDIQAESTVRSLQAHRADGGGSYCGIQRVVGTLDGRRGSFILQHQGTLQGKHMKTTWFVVPGSGTGDLRGLRGDGGFEAELGKHGSWTLDYWFE